MSAKWLRLPILKSPSSSVNWAAPATPHDEAALVGRPFGKRREQHRDSGVGEHEGILAAFSGLSGDPAT